MPRSVSKGLAVVVFAAACQQMLSYRPPSEIVATLDRGACNGECPVYSLVIYRDGTVEYIDLRFVKADGGRRAHLSPLELVELRRLFERADYFALGGSYEREQCVDVPLISTSYQIHGKTKAIQHCADAPRALIDLETAIDRLVRSDRWVR